MTKKIQDSTKASPMFAFAKIKGLNNREAARFHALFIDEVDFTNSCNKSMVPISCYLTLSKEPKVDMTITAGNHEEQPQVVTTSRSKLVMAYEKQRKAYLKIKEIRHAKPEQVNTLFLDLHPFTVHVPSGMTYRTNALQHILRNIV